jgi:putative ABC transport system permease protein
VKPIDIVSYALNAIRRKKTRKGLAILGVTIGIAAIISLVSLSNGFRGVVTTQFERGFSSDVLIVTTQSLDFLETESDFQLFVNDTELINSIDNVTRSVALLQRTCYLDIGGRQFIVGIVGVDFETYQLMFDRTFIAAEGTISDAPDNISVVIGSNVNDPWKNGTTLASVMDEVNITWTTRVGFTVENKTYTGRIDAILDEIGGSNIGGPVDIGVYIPIETAMSFFDTDEVGTILVQLIDSSESIIQTTTESIFDIFAGQAQVVTPKAVLDAIGSIVTTIELFLTGVSAISLLVAGVGIMNIMLTSLMERTREIGILRSLGMLRRTVLSVFLTEALMIGVIGSIFGIITGAALAISIDRFGIISSLASGTQNTFLGEVTISPIFTPDLMLTSAVFGMFVSVLFGLYPAWRAARLDPVEALRYE